MTTISRQALLRLCAPVVCLTAPVTTSAQNVFASMQSATLPTAAASRAGEILIEISHRFGPLSDGASDLWGLDETAEANEMQAYGQVIANAMFASRLALGVVPTLLWNPRIEEHDREATISVGVNGQLYLDQRWSLFGEWIFSEAREDQMYDSGSFGAEVRTSGHCFKLLVTNQHQMNPIQTLAGAAEDFLDPASWRFGFNVQRTFGSFHSKAR